MSKELDEAMRQYVIALVACEKAETDHKAIISKQVSLEAAVRAARVEVNKAHDWLCQKIREEQKNASPDIRH